MINAESPAKYLDWDCELPFEYSPNDIPDKLSKYNDGFLKAVDFMKNKNSSKDKNFSLRASWGLGPIVKDSIITKPESKEEGGEWLPEGYMDTIDDQQIQPIPVHTLNPLPIEKSPKGEWGEVEWKEVLEGNHTRIKSAFETVAARVEIGLCREMFN
jgi:hypothetical protein